MYPEVLRPRLRPIFCVLPIIAFAFVVAAISSIHALRYLDMLADEARVPTHRYVIETWSTLTIVEPPFCLASP